MKLAVLLVFVYVGICLAVYLAQRQLLYFPDKTRISPSDAGLTAVEEIVLTSTSGDALVSWYARVESGPTVLFFHGNGGNIATRTRDIEVFQAEGYGVLMVGYPGYGGNSGKPSEAGFMAIAKAAYDFLQSDGIDAEDIVLYGESLGSAVAVQLATSVNAGALVLEAPMSSVQDIARQAYPYLPIKLLLKDTFLSRDYIANIEMPLLACGVFVS